jgi:hypothetical protein
MRRAKGVNRATKRIDHARLSCSILTEVSVSVFETIPGQLRASRR